MIFEQGNSLVQRLKNKNIKLFVSINDEDYKSQEHIRSNKKYCHFIIKFAIFISLSLIPTIIYETIDTIDLGKFIVLQVWFPMIIFILYTIVYCCSNDPCISSGLEKLSNHDKFKKNTVVVLQSFVVLEIP